MYLLSVWVVGAPDGLGDGDGGGLDSPVGCVGGRELEDGNGAGRHCALR